MSPDPDPDLAKALSDIWQIYNLTVAEKPKPKREQPRTIFDPKPVRTGVSHKHWSERT